MKLGRARSVALAAAAAALVGAPATQVVSAAGTVPGTSVSITRFTPFAPQFHPMYAEASQYLLYYAIFDTLIERDLDDPTLQTYVPSLAESWTVSDDATTFT